MVVVGFTSFRLLELEVSAYRGAVLGRYRHLVTAARGLRSLPVVDELAAGALVTEARAARRQELDGVLRCAGRAGDLRSLQRLLDVGRIGQFGGALEELEL